MYRHTHTAFAEPHPKKKNVTFSLACFVIDGAWDKDSRRGAAAVCDASWATMVELRVGLLLLEWAVNRQLVNVCIRTDCLVFDSLFVVFVQNRSMYVGSRASNGFKYNCVLNLCS